MPAEQEKPNPAPRLNSNHHDAARELDEVHAEVIRAIRDIRYGSVEITIHDSRVVQIERKEKRRFEHPPRGS